MVSHQNSLQMDAKRRTLSRERSNSPVSNDLDTLRHQFSIMEKQALRISWNQLKGRQGTKEIVDLVYKVLQCTLDLDSTSSFLFFKAAFAVRSKDGRRPTKILTMYEHAKYITNYLEKLVLFINDTLPQADELEEPTVFGLSHGKLLSFGLTSELFIHFRDLLLQTLWAQDAVRGLPYGYKAWKLLVCSVIRQFRNGFQQAADERDETRPRSPIPIPMNMENEKHQVVNERKHAVADGHVMSSSLLHGGFKSSLGTSLAISFNSITSIRKQSPKFGRSHPNSAHNLQRIAKGSSCYGNQLLPSPLLNDTKRNWNSAHNLSNYK